MSVFEERVRPDRTLSAGVDRVRRRRQIAAVNRGTAGRVGYDHAIAEQLRQEFNVRRLAAAGASAREFE